MNITNRTIAILGANGRMGDAAARAFKAAGWQVRAVTRTGKSNIPGIECLAADAMIEADLIRATEGCAFIFNGLNPIYTDWADKVMPMSRNVMAAAGRNRAVHLYPGNVYNFGTVLPGTLDEDTPQCGDHRKAALRMEAEALFARMAREHGVQTIILRAGDFFGGKGRGAWFDLAIASKFAGGKVVYPGPRDIVHAWSYLPDLARGFVALAEEAGSLNTFERFHFPGHNVTGAELHAAVERASGRKLKPAGFPWPVFAIGALFVPMWREILIMRYLWLRPHRLTGARLASVIGTVPHTPLDEAVFAALGELDLLPRAANVRQGALPSLAA